MTTYYCAIGKYYSISIQGDRTEYNNNKELLRQNQNKMHVPWPGSSLLPVFHVKMSRQVFVVSG